MDHQIYHLVPATGLVLFLAAIAGALRANPSAIAGWRIALAACLAFAGWSVVAVVNGGWTGFWSEHVRNEWSNQIWLDLLCAGALAFTLLAPRARAAGMRPALWGLLVIATGSVGLLAMAARCWWLEQRLLRMGEWQ